MVRSSRVLLFVAVVALASSSAMADTIWQGTLVGLNEVPPNASPATGFVQITLSGDNLTVDLTWANLLALPSASHIHCCTLPGTNVGVAVGFTGFPATLSGSYLHTFDLTNSAVYTASFRNNFGGGTAAGAEAALISGLDAGRAYVNIHNATFPGGEIRANVTAVPESGSLSLLGLGLAGLAALLVKRRRESESARHYASRVS